MKTTIELNNTPITIESIFAGTKNSLWDAKKEQHHIVSVSANNKTISFNFWTSIAQPTIDSEDYLLDAFYCFISDGMSADMSFNEFCNELGYDVYSDDDKQTASTIYSACRDNFIKLEQLSIGDIYDVCNELQDKYDL